MEEVCVNRNRNIYLAFLAFNYFALLCFFIRGPIFSNKLVSFWGIVVCSIFIFIQKKIRVDIRELLLGVAFLFYTIFTHKNFSWGMDIVLMPLVFAILGKYMANCFWDRKQASKIIYLAFSSVVAGYTLHGLLNSVIIFREDFQLGTRIWIDVWDRTNLPATQHIIYYLPVMSVFFLAIFSFKKYILLGITIVCFNIFFLYVSVITMSRASIVIWALVLSGEVFLWGILNCKNVYWKKFIQKVLPVCLLCFLVLIVIAWLIVKDKALFSSYDWLSRDGGILKNIRFKAQISAVKQILVYPFGGYQMELAGLNYAHNVWLDLANAAGVIPFVALVGYTILSFFDLIKLLKSAYVSQGIKYAASGIYLAFVLYYMIEPALEANILYLIPWIYINGIIYGFNQEVSRFQ